MNKKILIRSEFKDNSGITQVSYSDFARGDLVLRYGENEAGAFEGVYAKYDDNGERTFETYYKDGVEKGPRVEKIKGIDSHIWRHTDVSTGTVGYTITPTASYSLAPEYISTSEVKELIAKERSARERLHSQEESFDPEDWLRMEVLSFLDKEMSERSLDHYSFSQELKEIFGDHIVNYNRIEDFFEDLSRGCASGILGEFAYYSDTKEFYVQHMDDIESYIEELSEESGSRIKLGDPHYNFATWLVVEGVGHSLSDGISDSFEQHLNDSFHTLSDDKVEDIVQHCSMQQVCDIAYDYLADLRMDVSEERSQAIAPNTHSINLKETDRSRGRKL